MPLGVEQARELTGKGKKDDAVARVFQLLATGSYMDKYTNGGKVCCSPSKAVPFRPFISRGAQRFSSAAAMSLAS